MKRRLIVLFDGTWNTSEDRTNVELMRESLLKQGTDGVPQLWWYDQGPGTNWYDRIREQKRGQATFSTAWKRLMRIRPSVW